MTRRVIRGRPLRPAACSCPKGCVSREEMRRAHGEPDDFTDALAAAWSSGDIAHDEAERANLRYRREWAAAPEHTKVPSKG